MVVRLSSTDKALSSSFLPTLRHAGKILAVSALGIGLTAPPVGQDRFSLKEPSSFWLKEDPSKSLVGTEFPVNTYTTSSQLNPSVAMDQDGNFTVVWQSNGQDDGTRVGIHGQRFGSVGNTIGSEFQVNTYTTSIQQFASVAMDQDGDFIVVWESYGQDGSSNGIFGQQYNSTGSTVGSEFQVNFYTTNGQGSPSVAMDTDGDFVVVWQSFGQDGSGYGMFGQRFNSAGSMVGAEFQVNSYTTSSQFNPSVAMDHDGDFVVVWISQEQDGSSNGIFGQRFNSAGSMVGAEFQVNSYTTSNQLNPSVAMDQDGNFTIVWQSNFQDGSDWGIFGQRYNSDGSTVGSEFQVNSYTLNGQIFPSVAMDQDGDFVVAWTSFGQDGEGFGIFGQRFDANPAAAPGPVSKISTGDISINNLTAGDQRNPVVALDAPGNYVIAFESQDGSADGINAVRGLGSLDATVVDTKVLLHGALSSVGKQSGTLMRTDLQTAGLIPNNQPYNSPPWNYSGTETAAAFGPDVVDWILIRLRSTIDGANMATRAGLLLSDGSITDVDGISRLTFPGVAAGAYFVVIEHRNHLSIVSAAVLDLSPNSALYDFTSAASQASGDDLYDAGGVFAMYGGNANPDGKVVYIGGDRDQLPIINELGTANLAGTSPGYLLADMNLDGEVVYIGAARDQRVIIETLGTSNLADVKETQVPDPN